MIFRARKLSKVICLTGSKLAIGCGLFGLLLYFFTYKNLIALVATLDTQPRFIKLLLIC